MSLVNKIANGAKKGFDWFTFTDGVTVQQKYIAQAIDIDSGSLKCRVIGTTFLYHGLTAIAPALAYSYATHYALNSPTLDASQVYLGCFLALGLEKTRLHIREHFFSRHHEIFARQVERALKDNTLPEQKLPIDGPEPLPFEKDADYWKQTE